MERRTLIAILGLSAVLCAGRAVAQGQPTQPPAHVDSARAAAPAAELTEAPANDTIIGTDGFVVVRARSDGNVNLVVWTAAPPRTTQVDPSFAAAWVDSAVASRPPGGDSLHPKYVGVVLPLVPAGRVERTMVLMKLSADSAPGYRLELRTRDTVRVTLAAEAARHLFATLRALPPSVSDSERTCPVITATRAAMIRPPLPTSLVGRDVCVPGDVDDAPTGEHDGAVSREGAAQNGTMTRTFPVRYIVDEKGRVERGSFEVLTARRDRFTNSIAEGAYLHIKSRPATIGGRAVKELRYDLMTITAARGGVTSE